MADKEMYLNMLKDIKNHKKSKDNLLAYYIQKRLNLSLDNYYSDLVNDYNLLTHKNSLKVLRELTKGDT